MRLRQDYIIVRIALLGNQGAICGFSLVAKNRGYTVFSVLTAGQFLFLVRTIPAIAPIKISGATLTKANSKACRAVPATAVSGLL